MKNRLFILLLILMLLLCSCGSTKQDNDEDLYTVTYYSGGQVVEKYEHVSIERYSDRGVVIYKNGKEITEFLGDMSLHKEYKNE